MIGRRYALIGRLGEGGQGEVFRAEDQWFGARQVAIKRASLHDRDALTNEFLALAEIEHPAWPRAFDYLTDESFAYLVEELIEGEGLAGWSKWQSGQSLCASMVPIAHLLCHLHGRQIAHGDIQPHNIMVRGDTATLIDPGLSRRFGSTLGGGTPNFTAPELMQGGTVSAASDVFSFARVLEEVGAGQTDPKLESFLKLCTAPDPARRPVTIDVLEELRRRAGREFPILSDGFPHGLCVGRDKEFEAFSEFLDGYERVFGWHGPGAGVLGQWAAKALWANGFRVFEGALDLLGLIYPLVDGASEAALAEIGPDIAAHITHPRLREVTPRVSGSAVSRLAGLLLEDVAAQTPVAFVGPVGDQDWLSLQTQLDGNRVRVVAIGDHAKARKLNNLSADDVAEFVRLAWIESPGRAELDTFVQKSGGDPDVMAALARGEEPDAPVVPEALRIFARWGRPLPISFLAQHAGLTDLGVGVRNGDRLVLPNVSEELTVEDCNDLAQWFSDAELTLECCLAHAQAGDTEDALAAAESLVPSARAEVYTAVGEARLRAEQRADWMAIAVAQGAAQLAERLAGDADKVVLARCWYQVGNYEKAAETLGEVDDPEALALRGRMAYVKGSLEDALQLTRDALKLDVEHADALEVAGLVQLGLGNLDQAEADLEQALRAGAHGGQVENLLGMVAQQRQDWDAAIRYYTEATMLADPGRRVGRQINLATALQDSGRLADALETYERALRSAIVLENSRDEIRARINMTTLFLLCGELSSALRHARSAAQLATDIGLEHEAARATILQADILAQQERWAEADQVLTSVERMVDGIEDTDTHLERLTALAMVCLGSERKQEATSYLSEAIALEPSTWWKPRIALLQAECAAEPSVALEFLSDKISGDDELAWRWFALRGKLSREAGHDPSTDLTQGRSALERWLKRVPNPETYLAPPPRARLRLILSAVNLSPGRYEKLLHINRQLAAQRNPEVLLQTIVDHAVALLGAEHGAIVFRQGDKDFDIPVARRADRQPLPNAQQEISRSVVRRVFDEGASVLTTDAQRDDRFAQYMSVAQLSVRSVLCVPMRAPTLMEQQVFGVLYLDHRLEARVFTPDDLRLAEAFADQASIAYEHFHFLKRIEGQRSQLEQQNRRLRSLNTELQGQVARFAEEVAASHRSTIREGGSGLEHLVGQSAAWIEVIQWIEKLADSDVPVTIGGESGTGKELVARALHDLSPRAPHEFVAVNCAAIPETLFESELFGHTKGAFTGATKSQSGLLAAADKGTLFLDEIGDMPASVQAKLLRVLQEKEFRPVGANDSRKVDLRVIAASHRDLKQSVAEGRFREDLLYRLEVAHIPLPPLRERRSDIPLFIEHFSQKFAHASAEGLFTADALELLEAYDWPGNVRQLENEVQRALALADGTVKAVDLSPQVLAQRAQARTVLTTESRGTLKDIIQGFERDVIVATLERLDWNVKETAKELGLSRASLYTRMTRFGIKRT